MSNYIDKAFHPIKKEVQEAYYRDDYYGRHRYGIQFDDGSIFPEESCEEAAKMNDQIEKTKKQIEVMQAFADGETVEFRASREGRWEKFGNLHGWDWILCDYRVKREPCVVYINRYEYGYGSPFNSTEDARNNQTKQCLGVIRLVEDMDWKEDEE